MDNLIPATAVTFVCMIKRKWIFAWNLWHFYLQYCAVCFGSKLQKSSHCRCLSESFLLLCVELNVQLHSLSPDLWLVRCIASNGHDMPWQHKSFQQLHNVFLKMYVKQIYYEIW